MGVGGISTLQNVAVINVVAKIAVRAFAAVFCVACLRGGRQKALSGEFVTERLGEIALEAVIAGGTGIFVIALTGAGGGDDTALQRVLCGRGEIRKKRIPALAIIKRVSLAVAGGRDYYFLQVVTQWRADVGNVLIGAFFAGVYSFALLKAGGWSYGYIKAFVRTTCKSVVI